jgi:ankyrin repeat protein
VAAQKNPGKYPMFAYFHKDTRLFVAPKICKAIVNEKKRLSVERKKNITENATAEELHTALHQAASEGDHATIKRILKKKAGCFDINTVDKYGYSLLHTASIRGFTSVVKTLLKVDGIDVNREDNSDGASAFYWACVNGHIPIINLLLKVPGIEINPIALSTTAGCQGTAFWFACQVGHTAVIRRLLKVKGIEFNKPDKYGATPLYMASQNNFVPIVDLLLKNGWY